MKNLYTLLLALTLTPLYVTAQEIQGAVADETELPEGMHAAEIDSLFHSWSVSRYLSFDEDSCQTTNVNPVFEPEVYERRLRRLPNVIAMPYNQMVQKYIDQYSGRLRRSVAVMLGAGNFYNPIFEQALESYQVPLELKYLPVIESALNPGATSRVGAAGLWQFMIVTGKQYGLEVTSLIDERRDPIKASYAAARYLKDLYNIFGDWALVLASYNCGPGNVNKAIKRAGGATDYWTISQYLPRETQGYVPAFIAANYIMNYYCDHNICPVNTTLPQGTDTLQLSRNLQMEHIVAACDISMDELKALNPQYRTTLIPGEIRPCTLRMPAEKIGLFLEQQDSIFSRQAAEEANQRPVVEVAVNTKSADTSGAKWVTVKNGDSLGSIARRNRTTVARIRSLNGMKNDNIRAGKRLRVK